MLPLTEHRPKHLLDVGGVPFLAHQLAKLAAAGIRRVVLATSYRAELFEPLLGDGGRFGLELRYLREERPLGTGGAIRHAAAGLGADPALPVVVLNGDVLSGHDLGAQLRDFTDPRGGDPISVSLHLVGVADPRAFGCVPTTPTGRVLAFLEKSDAPPTDQVNAGCYVFRRGVVDAIPDGRPVSVEHETFPDLLRRGSLVVGYRQDAYWRDVGTPSALVSASCDVVTGRARSEAIGPGPGGVRVSPEATVNARALVEAGSVVSAGALVEAGAVVHASVVMAGARVGAGARLEGSVIGAQAEVGAGSVLRDCALGDGAALPPGSQPRRGTRVTSQRASGSGESM